jgi:hypothetical protein
VLIANALILLVKGRDSNPRPRHYEINSLKSTTIRLRPFEAF